jgi:hypothetical protein
MIQHNASMTYTYLDKSPSAGRMGKAVEYLVAASCILATRGELNVSTSLVDDEGVDLVFNRRNGTRTLAVQVKARMSDSALIQSGQFKTQVRSQTFQPRSDLDLLFVAVDIERGALMMAWLVPSPEYTQIVGEPDARGRLRFNASTKPASKDRWVKYRRSAKDLAPNVLRRLSELDQT